MTTTYFRVNSESEPVAVSLDRIDHRSVDERFEVRIGSVAHEVTAIWHSATRGCLRFQGRSVPFAASVDGPIVRVSLAGRVYELERVDRRLRRTASAATDSPAREEIVAPMPGTVLKISVAAGSAFAANEPILVMESMKMEMSLSSPVAGRVKEIRCRVGEMVNVGVVLAKLELSEAAGP